MLVQIGDGNADFLIVVARNITDLRYFYCIVIRIMGIFFFVAVISFEQR